MQPQKWTLAKLMRERGAEKGKEVRRGRGRERVYIYLKRYVMGKEKKKGEKPDF